MIQVKTEVQQMFASHANLHPSYLLYFLFLNLTATGGALAAGTLLGWTSPTGQMVVDRPNDPSFESQYNFTIGEEAWSWVGSSAGLGAAAMCVVIGTLINMFGRKLTMLMLVVPFVIGWALVTWAQSVAMLMVGRVLLGISGGAFCVTAPTYTAEIAQKEIRGTLGSYFQLMLTVGILFVYVLGSGVSLFVLNIICLVIPIVFGATFVFMPETPLYLVSKGRDDEAVKALKWLRGSGYDYSGELSELQAEHREKEASQTSIVSALMRKASVKALGISLGMMFFQQASGINAVIFYTGDIFTDAKTGIEPSVATIIVGVMQVIATFVSTLVVDKLGRRILLLASVIVMSICTILLGVYFVMQTNDPTSVESLGWLPIVALSVFIIMFSLGFGPIPWMMVGELFAPDVKGVAASMAGAFNWILAFIVTKTFVNIQSAIGKGETFFLFSGLSVIGILFVFFAVPETKGKSLSEIQTMLSGQPEVDSELAAPQQHAREENKN